MKYIVTAHPATSRELVSREIEIPSFANAVGKLVVITKNLTSDMVTYRLAVHVTAIPADIAAKISDTELVLHADNTKPGVLVGDLTPKGKRTKQAGGINTATRPEFKQLLDALVAAQQQVEEVRQAIFAEYAPKEPTIPAGMVRVVFSGSKLDGWVRVYTDAQGHEFDSPKIEGEEHGIAWMTPDAYQEAMNALNAQQAEQHRREITHLEGIVAQGEQLQTQGRLLSYAELRRAAKEYDHAYNEGGDGYNPYRDVVTLEEYNDAKQRLTQVSA